MPSKICLTAILSFFVFLFESHFALAMSKQVIEKERFTCDWATARQEQQQTIPRGLLKAISLAETGQWHAEDRESFAWPWTVTSGGPGKYFPSKWAAIREVRRLQAKGVTNIDIGCMQINLHFHGHHFDSLDEAFEPDKNAAYAADFLKRLYRQTGSWKGAAGAYHSKTPDRHARYFSKVSALWRRHLARVGEPLPAASEGAQSERTASYRAHAGAPIVLERSPHEAPFVGAGGGIDHERTAALNAKLALNRQQGIMPNDQDQYDQLSLLKAGEASNSRFGTAALVQRARAVSQQQKRLTGQIKASKQDRFAERRLAQLQNWRLKRARSQ